MRRMTIWWAGVLAALAVLLPGWAFGQPSPFSGGPVGQSPSGSGGTDYAPPAGFKLPLPLYSTNPASGEVFLNGGLLYYQESNSLKSQVVAPPGFVDGSAAFRGAGAFIGPHANALDVNQVTGPHSFQPGFDVGAGYRFSGGSALSVDYWSPTAAFSHADATLVPPGVREVEGKR
jgi:hypothetical protein